MQPLANDNRYHRVGDIMHHCCLEATQQVRITRTRTFQTWHILASKEPRFAQGFFLQERNVTDNGPLFLSVHCLGDCLESCGRTSRDFRVWPDALAKGSRYENPKGTFMVEPHRIRTRLVHRVCRRHTNTYTDRQLLFHT